MTIVARKENLSAVCVDMKAVGRVWVAPALWMVSAAGGETREPAPGGRVAGAAAMASARSAIFGHTEMRVKSLAALCAVLVGLAGAANGAPAHGRKAVKPPSPPKTAPPAVKPILPAPLPTPLDTSVYKPLKPTRLQTLADAKKGHDYGPFQMQFLRPYEISGDRQVAWIEDVGIAAVEAPRDELYIREVTDRLLGCWTGPRSAHPRDHQQSAGICRARLRLRRHRIFRAVCSTAWVRPTRLRSRSPTKWVISSRRTRLGRSNFAGNLEKIVDVVASTTTLARREARFQHSGNTVTLGMRPEFGSSNVLAASYGLNALAQDLITPNFEAQQEFDADAFALDLMVCAHFNPQAGATAAMITLSKGEALATTHLERAAAFAGKVIADEVAPVKSGDQFSQLKHQAAQLAITTTMRAALKAASEVVDRRKSPEARAKALQKYADKTYGGLPIIEAPE